MNLFHEGLALFNTERFYECHEVWEDLWRPSAPPQRLFLQAMIHFAVAFYHDQQANPVGARRQLRKGLTKLAAYLPAYGGLDTAGLYAEGVRRWTAGPPYAPYPKIQ